MKRIVCVVLTLVSLVSLFPSAVAARNGKDNIYIRILGTNGTITAGVRTTYGDDIKVGDSVVQDTKSEFVYTTDGINWSVSGPAPSYTSGGRYDGTQFLACSFQSNKPVLYSDDGITWNQFTMEEMDALSPLQLERTALNGYMFQCDRDGNVWVTDGSGLQARLAEFDAFTQSGFLPSEIQAYPVPQGIRVIVYAKFDYEMDYAHTYSLQTLNTLLGGGRPAQSGISVSIDGVPVRFPAAPYQVKGCTMAPMRAMAEAMGYTFSYNAVTGTAVCTKSGSAIEVSVDSTWATVNGKTTNWLAVPAELQGGVFCIPVRFFAEAAGVEVEWDPSGRNFLLSLKAGS